MEVLLSQGCTATGQEAMEQVAPEEILSGYKKKFLLYIQAVE